MKNHTYSEIVTVLFKITFVILYVVKRGESHLTLVKVHPCLCPCLSTLKEIHELCQNCLHFLKQKIGFLGRGVGVSFQSLLILLINFLLSDRIASEFALL